MKIIVGLGNPGGKYERTRHNAGFMAIDALARNLNTGITRDKYHALIAVASIDAEDIVLAKPQTYMNDSGRAVAAIMKGVYAAVTDLIVIHDELDLPLGVIRIKIGGGHGGHNGLRSIIDYIGSAEYIRVRIGIGRPAPGLDAADYVLSTFQTEEKEHLPDIMARAGEAIKSVIRDGPIKAMNIVNQK